MKRQTRIFIAVLACLGLAVAASGLWWHSRYYIVTSTEYHEPPDSGVLMLADDRLEDKNPVFDPTLVDSRPLGDWEVNKSAAVIKLDCPTMKPDTEGWLLELRPSYAEAAKTRREHYLPSANMLDGAAKQFDDGLYAALDLACFRGELGLSPAVADFVAAVFVQLSQDSPARPFLAAALELAGKKVDLKPEHEAKKRSFLTSFERDRERSKPISFYNWTPELQQVWRVLRFLQLDFGDSEPDGLLIPRAVAVVLNENPELLEQYQAINAFYGRLTNPLICLPVDVLIGERRKLQELAEEYGARWAAVAVFPPSTSRETELYDRLFPVAIRPGVNLMAELVRRIRSGQVDLAPDEDDGWYQYQAYALEAMLLPSKGQEKDKLLLTAKYKKRLVEAFKALVTKRRETHARQLGRTMGALLRAGEVRPRLRVEPCATFYLRTARGYAFLQNFLLAIVGRERLSEMHGLRKDGMREPDLAQELDAIRQRFYGFYLIACEDIGMRPQFLEDEPVDVDAAKKAALSWLENAEEDPDLACDTRVAVPIYVTRNKTRLWGTIGVRLARLEASYARPPKIRPKDEGGQWQDVELYQLGTSSYVIPVDEFAEFEMDGSNALTRAELRAICDQYGTKEEILQALAAQ